MADTHTVRTTVTLPGALVDALQALARVEGRSISNAVAQLLREALDHRRAAARPPGWPPAACPICRGRAQAVVTPPSEET